MHSQSSATPRNFTASPLIAPARAAAFVILRKVATTAGHSDDLLHAPAVDALSLEDRNLTMTLVLGVLRWQLELDSVIRPMLQRPDAEMHPAALLALRLGVFQLQHLQRIPAHAAINESVELARANGAEHTSGLVNALLRRLLREADTPKRQTLAAASPAEIAHPQWLVQRWRSRYGGRATRAITGYDQAEPPSHELFAADNAGASIDDGSRLVAELAAAANPTALRILDCCAAPGGKTRLLARRFPDAEIVAVDVSERRLNAMRKRLDADPLASHVRTVIADMTEWHVPKGPEEAAVADPDVETPELPAAGTRHPLHGTFDLILVDAPCSGTGTLARNPEIRHRLQESDLARQAERQSAIVRNALRRLAPGGRLVYSTCSLEPEENEAVTDAVLAEGGTRVVPAWPLLEEVPTLHPDTLATTLAGAVTPAGALRTLPGVHPCDGFYAAVIEKVR